jgi:flagellar assembly protein FliH
MNKHTNYSRFIPVEEIDDVAQWNFGSIDTAAQTLAAQVKVREAALLETQTAENLKKSYQDGFTAGRAQGHKTGHAQGYDLAKAELQQQYKKQMDDFLAKQARQEADRLIPIFAKIQSDLADAAQVMAQGVLELSCEVARQILRQELSINPHVLVPVIREALDLLGAEHKSAVLRMNTVDVDVFLPLVEHQFADMQITLRADNTILPGGCHIESAGTVVDASLQKRWQRAVASLGLDSAWETPDEPS